MRSTWRIAFALALAGGVAILADTGGETSGAEVRVVELEGAIGPASADYFIRALERADEDGIELLVLRLDTPGGLDKSMRDMIKAILASPVPVATYVAPNGSRAASAGTYIMYASHIAAMAPATNIGSSTPVNIGGEGSPLPIPTAPQPPADEPETTQGEESNGQDAEDGEPSEKPPSGSAMDRKVVNDAVAYIKGLAELRGRNADWAEATVREAANLTATEALEMNVIDLVAADLTELLEAVDGRTVNAGGVDVTIVSSNARVEFIVPDWRYELLGILTDPNVALILLMIGFYGIVLEFYSPGIGIGAVTGVICLLLGAFALQMLPINYAGLALIIVGIALLATEAFTPSFGVFGVGGVIAFVVGAIILMDTDLPAYQLSKPVIAAVAVVSVGIMVFVLGAAVRARRARSATGRESMVGGRAEVVEDFEGRGRVRAFGEVWQAEGADGVAFKKDTRVTITGFDGLTVRVEENQSERN
ncbi:MAG: nodulation protein NfeD [Gammaproteobacteria bacterium]|nr:nodulation protein NfeD [Gammaproteobacteria bacterium]